MVGEVPSRKQTYSSLRASLLSVRDTRPTTCAPHARKDLSVLMKKRRPSLLLGLALQCRKATRTQKACCVGDSSTAASSGSSAQSRSVSAPAGNSSVNRTPCSVGRPRAFRAASRPPVAPAPPSSRRTYALPGHVINRILTMVEAPARGGMAARQDEPRGSVDKPRKTFLARLHGPRTPPERQNRKTHVREILPPTRISGQEGTEVCTSDI